MLSQLSTYFVLVLGGLLLVPLAEFLRLPAPVLTTVYGLLLALMPFVPALHLSSPEALLPVLLPPLLYAAARRSSWRQFAANLRPILLLAIVLVFATAAVVALVATKIHPMLPIGAAIVLGAITSPPDAAAVTTIAGRLGLPRRLTTVLEGEGLFNDVAALTLYQTAVAGMVAGSITMIGAVGYFAYSITAAIVIGLLVGWLAKVCFHRLDNARLTTGLSLLVPYLAYVPADELHGSGVLAVLTTAFYLGARSTDPDDIEGRLIRASFWDVTELMVTAITFGIVGLELVSVLRTVHEVAPLVWKAILISLVVIAVRALWISVAALLPRWGNWSGPAAGWRVTTIVAWSGMRGVVTIVTALALPTTIRSGAPFPGREQILLIAMVVVVVTLLLQGLTLPLLIRVLGVRADARREAAERRKIVAIAQHAAAVRLSELTQEEEVPEQLTDRLKGWFATLATDPSEPEEPTDNVERPQRVKARKRILYFEAQLLSAARAALVTARTQPGHDPIMIDEILQALDIRSAGRRL